MASMMERSPRAPVLRSIAFLAMAPRAGTGQPGPERGPLGRWGSHPQRQCIIEFAARHRAGLPFGPSSLNRPIAPLAGTSRFHRTAAYTRCLRCAGAPRRTREWFRAFTAHSFLACRPLRPRGVRHRYPDIRCRHWPSPNDHRLGTPDTPAIRFTRAVDFVASLVRFRYSLPGCSPPCTDQTGTPSLRGLLLPGFQRVGLPPHCWI